MRALKNSTIMFIDNMHKKECVIFTFEVVYSYNRITSIGEKVGRSEKKE